MRPSLIFLLWRLAHDLRRVLPHVFPGPAVATALHARGARDGRLPLERTAWAELLGGCVDRYGIHGQVDVTGDVHLTLA